MVAEVSPQPPPNLLLCGFNMGKNVGVCVCVFCFTLCVRTHLPNTYSIYFESAKHFYQAYTYIFIYQL